MQRVVGNDGRLCGAGVLVVDTSVLASLYLPGEYTCAAEALLQDRPIWIAPPVWRSGFRAILADYMRRKILTFEQAFDIQMEAETLFGGCEVEVESRAVLGLVRESKCSAYECEFVALAAQVQSRLVTMDQNLLRTFPLWTTALTEIR